MNAILILYTVSLTVMCKISEIVEDDSDGDDDR